MKFQTVSIVKHPFAVVWKVMRDDLPALAPLLDDISSVTLQERREVDGVCRVVNIWKAAPQLPQPVAKFLDSSMFVWTDRAEWNESTKRCEWTIEPHRFRETISCHGTTVFEPAMGGSGTKVTFSGELEYNGKGLSGVAGLIGSAAMSSAEGFVRGIVEKNFRKIAAAVTKHLGG